MFGRWSYMISFFHNGGQHDRSVRLLYVVFAVFTAVIYDLLWIKSGSVVGLRGLGLFVFTLAYVCGFTLLSASTKHIRNVKAFLLLVPILVLSVDLLWYQNSLLHGLAPKAIMALLFGYSVLLTLHNPERHKFHFLRLPIISRFSWLVTKWGQVYRDLISWRSRNTRDERYRKVLVGVLLSVPLVLLFGLLFFRADQVFADLVKNLFSFHIEVSTLWRIIRATFLSLFFSSFFYILIDPIARLGEKKEGVTLDNDTVVAVTVMTILNILFFAFVIIQVPYLFGSAEFILNHGITFAEYARRGFGELLFVLVISLSLIFIFYRDFASKRAPFIRALSGVFLLFVGIIATSAWKRLMLYQEAYGFTVSRLLAEWFIYAAIFLCLFIIIAILRSISFRRLCHSFLFIGLVFITTVLSINVDNFIARRNIDAYLFEGKKLDSYYLLSLSFDAAPSIAYFYEYVPVTSSTSDIDQHRTTLIHFWEKLDTYSADRQEKHEDWRNLNLGYLLTPNYYLRIKDQLELIREKSKPKAKDAGPVLRDVSQTKQADVEKKPTVQNNYQLNSVFHCDILNALVRAYQYGDCLLLSVGEDGYHLLYQVDFPTVRVHRMNTIGHIFFLYETKFPFTGSGYSARLLADGRIVVQNKEQSSKIMYSIQSKNGKFNLIEEK